MHAQATFRPVLLLAALAACASPAARAPEPAAAPAAEQERNLQVLPDTISREALTAIMRNIANSLGVRCTYCHVGREGAPLDSLDFRSDDKQTKHTARDMMRMVRHINGELMPRVAGLEDGRMQVTCMTCHRGAPRPLMLEDTLLAVARRLGVDSTLAAYGRLRAQHYGRFTFDFGERSLSTLAARLAAEGRQADARRVLELNAEQFPSSPAAALELGRIYEALGERERAVEQYRRVLSLQPNNRQAQERLRALGVSP